MGIVLTELFLEPLVVGGCKLLLCLCRMGSSLLLGSLGRFDGTADMCVDESYPR